MALNMDDLIGSMQHGFHAGDRGNDLNEIRESLKMSLGQQAQFAPSQPQVQPRRPQQQNAQLLRQQQWDPRSSQPPSSLDADVAMLSGSIDPSGSSSRQPQWPSYQHQQSVCFGGSPTNVNGHIGGQSPNQFGGPGSFGSQGSTTSSFGFGSGYAPAPANTPQQTPVESSALARQLQAELERARETQSQDLITEVDERSEQDWQANGTQSAGISPTYGIPNGTEAASPGHTDPRTSSPRKYINGFSPSQPPS